MQTGNPAVVAMRRPLLRRQSGRKAGLNVVAQSPTGEENAVGLDRHDTDKAASQATPRPVLLQVAC